MSKGDKRGVGASGSAAATSAIKVRPSDFCPDFSVSGGQQVASRQAGRQPASRRQAYGPAPVVKRDPTET